METINLLNHKTLDMNELIKAARILLSNPSHITINKFDFLEMTELLEKWHKLKGDTSKVEIKRLMVDYVFYNPTKLRVLIGFLRNIQDKAIQVKIYNHENKKGFRLMLDIRYIQKELAKVSI